MTINEYLFSDSTVQEKKEVVESLSVKELSSVNSDTLKRIIQKVGNNIGNSSRKELKIPSGKRPGNDWNSWFEGIGCNNGKAYVILYIQLSNTDKTLIEDLDKFFLKAIIREVSHGMTDMGIHRPLISDIQRFKKYSVFSRF